MNRTCLAAGFAIFLCVSFAAAAPPPEGGWEAADKVFGQTGKDLPGDVHRFGWPRSDLHVTVRGVPVEPGLALGGWAGFKKTGSGDDAVTMGDLVLLESELEPVLGELEAGGFDILAIHNHLNGETPHVVYLHFHGHGEPAALARTLNAALALTKTPAPGKAPAKATPAQEKVFEKLQDALGRKGTMSGTRAPGQRGARRADHGRRYGSATVHGHDERHELSDRRNPGRDDGGFRPDRRRGQPGGSRAPRPEST